MAWPPLGRNGRPLTADGSAVTTDADGLGDKPNCTSVGSSILGETSCVGVTARGPKEQTALVHWVATIDI